MLARTRFLRRLVIVAFGLAVVCGSLELLGWAYLTVVLEKSARPKFRFNSYRVYEHVPGFREGDGTRDWLVIDAQGFRRSSDVEKRKPPNTIRIFLMGGSAAHGTSAAEGYPRAHVQQRETIDAALEAMLRARHPGRAFEVINAAVTGYQVFQHTAYILSELLDYHPDLIVFMDGANDHYVSNPDYESYADFPYQFWRERLQSPRLVNVLDYSLHWAARYSAFARGYEAWRLSQHGMEMIFSGAHPPMHLDYESADALIAHHRRAAKTTFLRSIEINLLVLRASGVKAVIALQPWLHLRQAELLSKAEQQFPLFWDPKISRNVTRLHPTVAQELRDLTSTYDVPLLDLRVAFDDPAYGRRQLFIDHVHLSALGSDVVARALLPVVERSLDLRAYRTRSR